jgi:hypothetical protein
METMYLEMEVTKIFSCHMGRKGSDIEVLCNQCVKSARVKLSGCPMTVVD